MARTLTLTFPQRRAEIIAFVRKHHYTRRCPGVWSVAYGLENDRGKLQAVAMYGPPPYPSIARAFCRDQDHVKQLTWQTRMVGAGISTAALDELLHVANTSLARRGFWWVLTLTDPLAHVIEGGVLRLISPGYTGAAYARNGFRYIGQSGRNQRLGWLIDGVPVHCRQEPVTLTQANVREHYPEARSVRELHGGVKDRWVYVLGNTTEAASRTLLMAYHVQDWRPITQPRLFLRHLWHPNEVRCRSIPSRVMS